MSIKLDVRETGGPHKAIVEQLRAIANWINEYADTTIELQVSLRFLPKEAKK